MKIKRAKEKDKKEEEEVERRRLWDPRFVIKKKGKRSKIKMTGEKRRRERGGKMPVR